MQEIGDWLEKLGMPEYGECFAQNKIDFSVLPHLTNQDLKDIGVPLGHRRKMLAAISEVAADTASERAGGGNRLARVRPCVDAPERSRQHSGGHQLAVSLSGVV